MKRNILVAVMTGRCINIVANLTMALPRKSAVEGRCALAIGSSEACIWARWAAAWLRGAKTVKRRQTLRQTEFRNIFGFQVVQYGKIRPTLADRDAYRAPDVEKNTLDPEAALAMCDENTICIVPIQGVTWTGLNDDVEAPRQSAGRLQCQDGL